MAVFLLLVLELNRIPSFDRAPSYLSSLISAPFSPSPSLKVSAPICPSHWHLQRFMLCRTNTPPWHSFVFLTSLVHSIELHLPFFLRLPLRKHPSAPQNAQQLGSGSSQKWSKTLQYLKVKQHFNYYTLSFFQKQNEKEGKAHPR